MNTSAKGSAFERYVARLLRASGLVIYRSAASKGCADLVVQNTEHEFVTVQCKVHGRVRYGRDSGGLSAGKGKQPRRLGASAAANPNRKPKGLATYNKDGSPSNEDF